MSIKPSDLKRHALYGYMPDAARAAMLDAAEAMDNAQIEIAWLYGLLCSDKRDPEDLEMALHGAELWLNAHGEPRQ